MVGKKAQVKVVDTPTLSYEEKRRRLEAQIAARGLDASQPWAVGSTEDVDIDASIPEAAMSMN